MGKKSKSNAPDAPKPQSVQTSGGGAMGSNFLAAGGAIDPSLASLFAKSAGPVQAPQFTAQQQSVTLGSGDNRRKEKDAQTAVHSGEVENESSGDDEMVDADQELSSGSEAENDEDDDDAGEEKTTPASSSKDSRRKRKRGDQGDDLEASYMQRIAKAEEREHKKNSDDAAKRRKVAEMDGDEDSEESESESDSSSATDSEEGQKDAKGEENVPMPMHESLKNDAPGDSAVEKSSRTVFLGNVSSTAIKSGSAKKTLLAHLSSFFPSLAESGGGGSTAPKIESIRFRSTAYSSTAVPKRAAYAKRELMDATTSSTNAYAVYNTVAAARKALSLNGSIVLDRHLRVDSVAHPAKMDHRRCVFVGNLGFVDQEADEDEEGKKKKKAKEPADAEEGLWRTFNAHTKSRSAPVSGKEKKTTTTGAKGSVEYVRVVRDKSTRIGKGFAYVQFYDENAVEAALLLDGQKFPPLLPRKLRVSRAKRVSSSSGNQATSNKRDSRPSLPGANGSAANAKKLDKQASFAGRAARMLGQAGAAKLREKEKGDNKSKSGFSSSTATGANGVTVHGTGTRIVFEGHRASERQPGGGTGFKVKTKSRGAKARGKPKTRSAKRAGAWKKQKG